MGKRTKAQYLRYERHKNAFFEALTGMTKNRAYRKMVRNIIFDWFVLAKKDECIHCKHKVLKTDNWHIDHTKCFWASDTPLETYLDLKYLQLAHASCNIHHGTQKRRDLQI